MTPFFWYIRIMQRQYLLNLLENYATNDAHEQEMQARMKIFVQTHEDCFERKLAIGHITGSAWVVNPTRTHVLMLHHRKLDCWLQPGGHSDGDPNTLQVALRETQEESGIESKYIQPVSESIFDIDIHTIPARKNEPQHEHFDVRFLLEADDNAPLNISEESNELAWIPLHMVADLNNEESIMRMLNKTMTNK